MNKFSWLCDVYVCMCELAIKLMAGHWSVTAHFWDLNGKKLISVVILTCQVAYWIYIISQSTITYSKLTIETPEQGDRNTKIRHTRIHLWILVDVN